MRAGEDPGNTVPGNKTGREQGFARLIKLLSELKSAPHASLGDQTGAVAAKSAGQPVSCHGSDSATVAAATM